MKTKIDEREFTAPGLKLFLDPEDYADIAGVSLKSVLFGPKIEGKGGNASWHKSYDRMRTTRNVTHTSERNLRKFIENIFHISLLHPDTLPPEVHELGPWSFAKGALSERTPETYKALLTIVRASKVAESIGRNQGPKAFAAKLRMMQSDSANFLFQGCADRLEATNSTNYVHAMAPLHIFMAVMLLFARELELWGDDESTLENLHRLVEGSCELPGPQLALGRWMDTARCETGFNSKTAFFEALSLNFNENKRIEWQKVSSGKVLPRLTRLRADLNRCFEKLDGFSPGCELHKRLELGLILSTFVARSCEYLKKCGMERPERIYAAALEHTNLASQNWLSDTET
ncbi:MAG: hypothetical protein KGZ72_12055 [Roseovarius sp.]|jgi:hypothetical protein|nr:hypothetical protein [Roseovarius sp.]